MVLDLFTSYSKRRRTIIILRRYHKSYIKEFLNFIEHDNNYFKIPASFNVKDILLHKYKSKAGVFGISRVKTKIALKDVFCQFDSDANNDTMDKISIVQSKISHKFSQ